MQNTKIVTFTDLNAWKESHQLVLQVYSLTKTFPNSELFGLTNQIRRSSVSIESNIAEGFGRQGFKEKIQFYFIARGSIIELQNQLLVAKDVGYLTIDNFRQIAAETVTAHKILNGLIKSSKVFAA